MRRVGWAASRASGGEVRDAQGPQVWSAEKGVGGGVTPGNHQVRMGFKASAPRKSVRK